MENRLFRLAVACAVLVLLFGIGVGAGPVNGQDTKEEPEASEIPPARDGHDRPTTYPKIRFSNKKKEGGKAEAVVDKKLKTRVYLLDVTADMSKSITVDGVRETTRLEHMVAQIERSLDALAKRKDPRLRFNIITYGTVDDFADGEEMQAVTAKTIERAKKWLGELSAEGDADVYTMLKECFEQEPDSATMIVGGKPDRPAAISDAEFKKYEDAGDHLLKQVKKWREEGKTTTLDITGVGLSEDERKYFKKLAEAAGGTYLDA